MDAHPEMTPEQLIDLIDQCPPGPWPNAWGTWDNTIEAHRRLVDRYIDNLKPSRVTYAQERGIVIAGGGLKYFPSVWVGINLLRHFGCKLPIQLWYLGDSEMDPYMKRLLEPLGVECIDAREVEREHPCRILCGWELKLFATLHSPFAQVLFLDADNGVVCDPTYLFDCEEFQRHGAVFWPDYACWTLKPGVWRVFGMHDMADPEVAQHERAFESGQYLIDKRRCDRELRLSLFYAEHSDFTFQHVYGDKECFHLGWRRFGTEYAMPSAGPGWNVHTIVQFDFRGQIVFQHRCQDKWRFGGNRFVDSLANEELCFQLVRDLASQWSGILWKNEYPTMEESETIASLEGTRALYRRVGYDERWIRLGPQGVVTEGAAECERLWHVNHVNNEPVLTLARLDRPTCHLRRDDEGMWRGAWLEHERMPVELIPEVQWKPVVDAVAPMRPRLIITIAVGDAFQQMLKYTKPLMEAYADRVNADLVVLTNKTQDWWGLEKFRVHAFAKAYERTLFVDADVFLTPDTPDMFELVPTSHVAMHDDWPHLLSHEWAFEERRNILESQGLSMDFTESTWNTGLVLCDTQHADLWRPPFKPFLPTHCAEQFWIEHQARPFPFFPLPTELNTQYWMPRFRELVPKAKVIHLANCPRAERVQLAREFHRLYTQPMEGTRYDSCSLLPSLRS
jgi:hypothetical protein